MINPNTKEDIILFDGECSFCNFWINYILRRDKKKRFKFCPFPSKFGKQILEKNNLPQIINSVVVFSKNKTYFKAEAVLYILKKLNLLEFCFYLLVFFLPYKNYFYDIIANRRYKLRILKGCKILIKNEKERFLK